jgi:hypothetical protein
MTMLMDKEPQCGGSALFESKDPQSGSYKGAERRRTHRRSRGDRRLEMRFELDKSDRRENPGRRAGDKTPRFW